jgi:hypothetical protein
VWGVFAAWEVSRVEHLEAMEKLHVTASGLILAAGFISVSLSGNAEMPQPLPFEPIPLTVVNIAPSGGTSTGFTAPGSVVPLVVRFERGYDPVTGREALRLLQGGLAPARGPSISANPDPPGHPWYGGSD